MLPLLVAVTIPFLYGILMYCFGMVDYAYGLTDIGVIAFTVHWLFVLVTALLITDRGCKMNSDFGLTRRSTLLFVCSSTIPFVLLLDRWGDVYHYVILGQGAFEELNTQGRGFSLPGKVFLALFGGLPVVAAFYLTRWRYCPLILFIGAFLVLGNRQALLFGFMLWVGIELMRSHRAYRWPRIVGRFALVGVIFTSVAIGYHFVRSPANNLESFFSGVSSTTGASHSGTVGSMAKLVGLYVSTPEVYGIFLTEVNATGLPFVYSQKLMRDAIYNESEVTETYLGVSRDFSKNTQGYTRVWSSGFAQIYLDFGVLGVLVLLVVLFLMSLLVWTLRCGYFIRSLLLATLLMNIFIFPLRDTVVCVMIGSAIAWHLIFQIWPRANRAMFNHRGHVLGETSRRRVIYS